MLFQQNAYFAVVLSDQAPKFIKVVQITLKKMEVLSTYEHKVPINGEKYISVALVTLTKNNYIIIGSDKQKLLQMELLASGQLKFLKEYETSH